MTKKTAISITNVTCFSTLPIQRNWGAICRESANVDLGIATDVSTAQLSAHLLLPPRCIEVFRCCSSPSHCLLFCSLFSTCAEHQVWIQDSGNQDWTHGSVQPEDMDIAVNFESIPKVVISLIKWPFLNRMFVLHGLKHCATSICFLLKCYVLSVNPEQSWIILVRSKILTLQFCWFIESFLLKILLLFSFVQYETFQIISKKMKTNFAKGDLILLSLAGSSPGFQSKNRYLSKEPIWFAFGSCDGCLLQEPWSIHIRRRARGKRILSYLSNTPSKCSTESQLASLLMKRSSFTKEWFQSHSKSSLALAILCQELNVGFSVHGNSLMWQQHP